MLVTGGSSGIGRATALAFAREGATVVIADIHVEGGNKTVDMIKENKGDAIFFKTDVSKEADVSALITTIVKKYSQLDCAYNNAGIEGAIAPTAEYTEKNWDHVIATNLKGVWLCMKYEVKEMLKRGRGSIVNTASVTGLVGSPGMPAYASSKGGILQLTRTAALEYAKTGIRINAVCPGAISTPMLERILTCTPGAKAQIPTVFPIGRAGTPEEVAEAVVWLCSDAASFITGHAMTIDGGMTIQ